MIPLQRNVLLTPGPATTTDTVKWAQVVPDICPREEHFGNLMDEVSLELTKLVADPLEYATVLFCGSGTAAVEAIISSVTGPDDTLLIVNNGAYGKRMCEIAAAYGLQTVEFRSAPQLPLDMTSLEQCIRSSERPITKLAVVHHETTTGLLNDIEAIGRLCGNEIDMIVDAMSSFAAVPIRMKEMNIRYLAASSNKCLQSTAGISFAVADKSRLDSPPPRRASNYYLNLHAQYSYFLLHRQMRFTPPVQTMYALKQAIDELKREGMTERYARYVKCWDILIAGLNRLGLSFIGSEEGHSKMVTSIIEPDLPGYDFYELHDFLFSNGFTIYPGKIKELSTFRIANIGDISCKDIEELLTLLGHYFNRLHGRGVTNDD
ncbi:2-aminoethylphosphonate aminotransferase [Paenibacillus sp. NEAU-GSW1]|uniref:2-aminoethylphosphonate aminotransferase n=1 Tax=Paenibacillus sp. NEAU-GSW1 TaxID=2682486 RepID=UPI0012E289CF|nr:2-aminoethylphosphonate--pyruvate transaminase [Paenibacillus sp. NEAU-GSW1]MUT68020.1 2-aminoethylphosphonate--pyruvate transaminase [Paenibacillus sp. NEAU-GSW1]